LKHLLFAALLSFFSCADQRPEPLFPDDIRGEWVRVDDETRHYIFEEDFATTWNYNFGSVLAPHWYAAEQTGDRVLTLKEINKGNTYLWKFSETDGQMVTVVDVTTYPHFYFNLKRKQ
jgi:hypothetical protein